MSKNRKNKGKNRDNESRNEGRDNDNRNAGSRSNGGGREGREEQRNSESRDQSSRSGGGVLETSKTAFASLSEALPEKFNTVRKLKDEGSRILQEARTVVQDAAGNIPEGAMRTIKDTQQKVVRKMRERPVLATACCATIAAVGAGILANRLVKTSGRQDLAKNRA